MSDLYSPLAGEIVDVNSDLDDDPSLVNTDPYGEGWMVKLKVENPDEVAGLLTAEQYQSHIDD